MFLTTELIRDVIDILSIENISIFGVFLGFIIYLLWDKRNLVKRLDKTLDDHRADLKEANKDIASFSEKYNDLVNDLKDIIRSK